MNFKFIVTLIVISLAVITAFKPNQSQVLQSLNTEIKKEPGDKFHKAQISDDDYLKLHKKWIDTGLSSLFSAMANMKLKRQRKSIVQKFGACSREATTVPKHAKCLSKLLKDQMKPDKIKKRIKGARFNKYRFEDRKEWTSGFKVDKKIRQKRSPKIKASSSYSLSNNKEMMTPVGSIAKMILETIKAEKKADLPSWHKTITKLQGLNTKRKKYKKELEEESEESMGNLAIRGMKEQLLPDKGEIEIDADELAKNPKIAFELAKKMKKKKKLSVEDKIVDVIREATKLGYALAGQNTTDFDRKNIKLVSPRFLGVTKDTGDDDEVNLISPSLFSLHNEGEGIENLTSIPQLLQIAGIKEHEIWLDIIMEASGVNNETEKLDQQLQDYEMQKTLSMMTNFSQMVDKDGTPLYATKQNVSDLGGDVAPIELSEKLHMSYTPEQLREMNSTGFSVLNLDQIEMIYGPDSPRNNSDAYERFRNLTKEQAMESLHHNVHTIADHGVDYELRQKDIVLSPIAFTVALLNPALVSQPVILSPVLLSGIILSPAVFGVIVLSPFLLTPAVLSPRILGTIILSPFAFVPIILTPFALHPAILSAGIFNPIILSPLLLTPFILSPQVFTPIILSPIALSPILFNPFVGSPIILSPFVLTPIIASPAALGALIMSPYALSPILYSPLTAFAAILSPSWLS